VALALGYGIYSFGGSVWFLLVNTFAQLVLDDPSFASDSVDELLDSFAGYGPQLLYFRIGETVFIYGFVLVQTLTLLLVALASYSLWRLRLRRLEECPHCLSHIPRAATVCRECSLEVDA
jgi:hypothetical protein